MLRRFLWDGVASVVVVQREGGNRAALFVEGSLARSLTAEFGADVGGVIDMGSVIGRRVEYAESSTGVVVAVNVIERDATVWMANRQRS